MNKIKELHSELSRLERESEMLDTIITMMNDEHLEMLVSTGVPRRQVITQLATSGAELAQAIWTALGRTDTAVVTEGTGSGDVRQTLRDSHVAFHAAAEHLPELGEDVVIEHSGLSLRREDVAPHRIAEVVLAHETLHSAWSLDEADPESVHDAIDAMVRRLESRDDVPSLTFATIEGDEWLIHGGGGQRVFGTREAFAGWLLTGEAAELHYDGELPKLPVWEP